MRHAKAIVIFGMLVTFLASATLTHASPVNYGGITCRPTVSCPDSSDAPTASEDIVAQGNSCVAGMGYSSNEGSFFDSMGLDSSGCLSLNSGVTPKNSAHTLPKCCVVKLPSDGTCHLHCDSIAN